MTPQNSDTLDQLRSMDEYEFEYLIAEIWSQFGWETEVTAATGDRGIDIVAEKSMPFQQKVIIQAKRYGENNLVGSPDIQQYSSLRQQEDDVDSVIIVTTSSFTSEAQQIAENLNVKLIDGDSLMQIISKLDSPELLREYLESEDNPLSEQAMVAEYLSKLSTPPWEAAKVSTRCPFCNKKISATRGSFIEHWENSDRCSPE